MGPLRSVDLPGEFVLESTRELPLHAQMKTSLGRFIRGLRLDTRNYHVGLVLWECSASVAFKVMKEIRNGQPHPTTLFAVSDFGVISAIQGLLRRKIELPDQKSYFGFDGSDFGAMTHSTLFSIANPFRALADVKLSMLDKKSSTENRVFVSPVILIHESRGSALQPAT